VNQDIGDREIEKTEVLDIGNQETPKPEITFPVGKLFMVVFRGREGKGRTCGSGF
jgi:hypothetical protein